jgi:hypothetical protein
LIIEETDAYTVNTWKGTNLTPQLLYYYTSLPKFVIWNVDDDKKRGEWTGYSFSKWNRTFAIL